MWFLGLLVIVVILRKYKSVFFFSFYEIRSFEMMYLCMNQIRQNLTLSDPSCLNYLRFKPISLLLHISVAVCTLVRALNMSALFW